MAIAFALASQSVLADVKSPRLTSVYGYELGGSALPNQPTRFNNFTLLELGVEWEANMGCGTFDPQVTVSNQLNGLTQGFQNMMGNIINNATAAVAGLPALIIQRANPGLYDLLQQGVLQGKLDMDFAEASCEDIQKMIMGEEGLPWEKGAMATRQQTWAEEINDSGGDAVAAKRDYDNTNIGNEGREWVCGVKHGGIGQPKVETVYDVVVAGYNILHNKNDICNNGSPTLAQRQDSDLYKYWTSADAAGDWVTSVVGEVKLDTCEGCRKIETEAGFSLEVKHSELAASINDDLEDLVTGATALTWQNLNRVSAPPVVVITPSLINTIRKRNASGQTRLIEDIANEVAYARIAEMSRLAIRMLRTGQKEPNVQSFPNAPEEIDKVINVMRENMELVKEAAKDVKPIASATVNQLLIDEESNLRKAKPVFNTMQDNKELRLE